MLRRALVSRCAAALAVGATLPLAFAPWSWWALAPLPPALAFRLASNEPPRRAFAIGFAFGIGLFGVGVSWIHVSMARFGSGGPVVATLATAALAALLAVFPALALAMSRWLCSGTSARTLLLVTPASWVLLEWTRTWALTGFPWLLLGYSQVNSPVGRAIAPVIGVLGTSALIAFAAGLLAWLSLVRSRRCTTLTLVGVAITAAVVTSLSDVRWTQAAGAPLDVALVQGNISQDEKWKPEMLARTLIRYRELTKPLWGVDLVVWPETALPVWRDQLPTDYIAGLRRNVKRYGTSLITGVPTRSEELAYNSAISVGAAPVYSKRHLVPFGEYVPLRDVLGGLLDVLGAPMSDFTPGTRAVLLPAAGYLAGMAICYEIAFGAEVADVGPKAAFLVNISNDAWFGDSLGPRQHLQISRMRAIELDRYLLRATNTGWTAVVDPKGNILAGIPPFEAGTLRAEITPRKGLTPYARWEDGPLLLVLAAVLGQLLLTLVMARLRRHNTESAHSQ